MKAEVLGGPPRRFPSGQEFEAGDEVVLKAGEAEQSDDYDVVGPATAEEYEAFTGCPAERDEAPVPAVGPDKPHPDYDEFPADKVISGLQALEGDDAKARAQGVLEYESAHKDRKTVVEAAQAVVLGGDS